MQSINHWAFMLQQVVDCGAMIRLIVLQALHHIGFRVSESRHFVNQVIIYRKFSVKHLPITNSWSKYLMISSCCLTFSRRSMVLSMFESREEYIWRDCRRGLFGPKPFLMPSWAYFSAACANLLKTPLSRLQLLFNS